jgi:ABC-type uncharacterized transport system substrate-binding protein
MARNAFTSLSSRIASFGSVVVLFLGTMILPIPSAGAHPHVFVNQRLNIVFDDKGLAGIGVHWEFDEMFAGMIAEYNDLNGNGRFEPQEVESVKENAFDYIKEHNYFTFIRIDGAPFRVKFITDFNAKLENNRLLYEFFIPCHVTATEHYKKVVVASYDPSYYTAIFFADKTPLRLTAGDTFKVRTKIREDADTTIYFGMIHPWALFAEFRKNP